MTDYVAGIVEQFVRFPDKREAHHHSQGILRDLANDPDFLTDVLGKFISREPSLLGTVFLPFIIIPIESNRHFELSAHLWPPLLAKIPAISHQSIHHHGKLLLTSIAAFGGGYESILFKDNWETDPDSGKTDLHVDKFYTNSVFNLEFVDTYTPHVVFFPRSFSVTFVVWSKDKDYPSENLKQNKLIRQFKEPIKKLIVGLGLQHLTGVNPEVFVDFCMRDGSCYAMRDRVHYKDCSNEDYIENLVAGLQHLPLNQEPLLLEMKAFFQKRGLGRQEQFVARALGGDRIDFSFYTPDRMSDNRVNIPKQDILRCFNLGDPDPEA